MKPRPYQQRLPTSTRLLLDQGYLREIPPQKDRSDLKFVDGVDILYRFRGLTPSKFRATRDIILQAAADECRRYRDADYKYASITTRIKIKGQKRGEKPLLRTYTAAHQADGDDMVFGVDGKEGTSSLYDRTEEILNAPTEYEGIVDYIVVQLTICIRNVIDEASKGNL